jgi:hypothetical protein
MAIVITKQVKIDSRFKMVKFQFLLYCYLHNIVLSDADLNCLTTVALKGYSKSTINHIVDSGIFKSEQTVRNCMVKLTTLKLLVKDGATKIVNPSIQVGIDNIIVLKLMIGNVQ